MSLYSWVYYVEATEKRAVYSSVWYAEATDRCAAYPPLHVLLIELLAEGFFKMKYKITLEPGCVRTVCWNTRDKLQQMMYCVM